MTRVPVASKSQDVRQLSRLRPAATSPARSRNMAAVRSRGNVSTELTVASLLRCWGHAGWRRHVNLYGVPDFSWRVERVALFVDGCFWHGCPRCYQAPRSHAQFWKHKVETNRARDKRVSSELRALGWTVIRVWECQVHSAAFRRRLERVLSAS